ncbi:hypothetical protein HDV04_000093 [Boothiomyces sp. JEL0838]|nr:hypothetical protein HDV04_000093 [Boothiomyces sp. JEL0838]
MKGFQIGDLVGKGASGTVYRAIDTSCGLTVAIKKIKKLSTVELQETMQEIVLLTKLSHENIVQLYGYEIIKDELLIIMEYGNANEVHRDIKSANLLTTKQGIVKLADFGIASKLGMTKRALFEGSPYWMAPEVIELNGSSSASDIWSVGCTALEMFTGSPPFYDLEPIAALFRIVSSDKIPYPKSISPYFEDFLDSCFQKDPNLRIQATRLLNHPWVNNSAVVQPKRAINDKVSWRHVDLELFKELSDTNDYSLDFADEELNLDAVLPKSQEGVESQLDDTLQDVIPAKIPIQKSVYEMVHESNCQNQSDLDAHISCLMELDKNVAVDIVKGDEYVQLFCNCFRKLPRSVLQLAFGSLIDILTSADISKKAQMISVIRKTIEQQPCISKDDLLMTIGSSNIPQIVLCLLNEDYPTTNIFNYDNKIEILTILLWKNNEKREFQLQILNSLFYILRHNRWRQEKSVQVGLLDSLKEIIRNNYPERQFAIPILCDLICNVDTKYLWASNVIEIFLPLLQDQCWRNTIFETIVLWYFRDTIRVEEYLLKSLVFLNFFSVKYFNSNAERQCISLLLQLVVASKELSLKLLNEGILNYLIMADNMASVAVSVDILKMLSLLLKPIYCKYWIANPANVGRVLKYMETLSTTSDSIVIKQLLIIIRQNIKSLFTNIYNS